MQNPYFHHISHQIWLYPKTRSWSTSTMLHQRGSMFSMLRDLIQISNQYGREVLSQDPLHLCGSSSPKMISGWTKAGKEDWGYHPWLFAFPSVLWLLGSCFQEWSRSNLRWHPTSPAWIEQLSRMMWLCLLSFRRRTWAWSSSSDILYHAKWAFTIP